MIKLVKVALWWLLAGLAFLFIPLVHVALNASGERTTYQWIFNHWRLHVKHRDPWGPIV